MSQPRHKIRVQRREDYTYRDLVDLEGHEINNLTVIEIRQADNPEKIRDNPIVILMSGRMCNRRSNAASTYNERPVRHPTEGSFGQVDRTCLAKHEWRDIELRRSQHDMFGRHRREKIR